MSQSLKSTSLKLPKNLNFQIEQHVINKGFGLRGKSKWIRIAIEEFFNIPDYPTLVDLADTMEDLDKVVNIRLPDDLMNKIENAVIEIRQTYPLMEGVRSKLIRASILQKIISSNSQ